MQRALQRVLAGEYYYGWIVVDVTSLVLLAAAGVRSAPGVMILPFQAEMGWSRTVVSFAVSIGLILYGATGPASGFLIDRFGPSRIRCYFHAIPHLAGMIETESI